MVIKEKSNSLTKNAFLVILIRFSQLFFPLITVTHLVGVINPENYGLYEFSFSIVSYFLLISQFGIPIFAQREVSKVRDNIFLVKKKINEFFTIGLVASILSVSILLISIQLIDLSELLISLLLVHSLTIFANLFQFEWVFFALEKFSYLSLRTFFVKLCLTIITVLTVKNNNHLLNYAFLVLFTNFFIAFINTKYLKKQIDFQPNLLFSDFVKNIKGLLIIFLLNITVSVYSLIDKLFIGFFLNTVSVAFYSLADRFIRVFIYLIISINSIILPRFSYQLNNSKDFSSSINLIKNAFNMITFFSFQISLFLFYFSSSFITYLFGFDYSETTNIVLLMIPLIYLVTISNFFGVQILFSLGKEKITTLSTLIASIFNLILNSILVFKLGVLGILISTLFSEFLVLLIQIITGFDLFKKYIGIYNFSVSLIPNLLILFLIIFNYEHMNSLNIIYYFLFLLIYLSYILVFNRSILINFSSRIKKFLTSLFRFKKI